MPQARPTARLFLIAAVAAGFVPNFASAYVDLAPTLGKIVGDAKSIVFVEVQGFDAATQTVTLRPITTIKGDPLTTPIVNRVAPPDGFAAPAIRQWAAAGSHGVWFATKTTALVCIGTSWYQQKKAGDAWKLGVDRPDLALAYCGTPTRLADAVTAMVAGKSAVLTTVVYGATDVDTSFDLALGRTNLPGLVRVQRVRGNLDMPGAVMAAASSGYIIGPGPVDPADLPALRMTLAGPRYTDAQRADAAESIGDLGPAAAAAADDLRTATGDAATTVRTAAAAARLRVGGADHDALGLLAGDLKNQDVAVRRAAVTATALAGPAAASLSSAVVKLVTDADESVRAAALATLTTLGPSLPPADASVAVAVLVPMLEDARWRVEAADALGRLGPAARPVPAKLVGLLNDPQPPVQWAAVRAMAQVGGPEARPAVAYMMQKLPTAPEVEQYNIMIYLSLLGPVAADAAPVLRSTRLKNPVLPSATLWAIGDTTKMPWESTNGRGFGGFGGPGGGGPPGGDGGAVDLNTYMYTAYIRELGERLRPASQALAHRLLDGTAGTVPTWGYCLLTADTAGSLATLTPKLADPDRTVRQRAAVALGYMGAAAAPAKPQLDIAIAKASDDKECRMLKWCLKKVSG